MEKISLHPWITRPAGADKIINEAGKVKRKRSKRLAEMTARSLPTPSCSRRCQSQQQTCPEELTEEMRGDGVKRDDGIAMVL
ncbi:hypothetical protein ACMD2_17801, partial [Ananas comosus]